MYVVVDCLPWRNGDGLAGHLTRHTRSHACTSGTILHSETLGQKAKDGTPFPELLRAKGVLPGIKVDTGLEPLGEFSPRETHTKVCLSV